LKEQGFELGNPCGEAFHRDRFNTRIAEGGGNIIVALVAGQEGNIGDRSEFGFEIDLLLDVLGGIGRCLRSPGAWVTDKVCTKPRVPLRR
jgi:hypothetical protein